MIFESHAHYDDEAFDEDRESLLLALAGCVNWGLVGLFQLDAVALYLGGAATIPGRVAYPLAARGGIGCLPLLFRGK